VEKILEHCFSIKFSSTADAMAAPSKVVVPLPAIQIFVVE
jgi:hypothetical protein